MAKITDAHYSDNTLVQKLMEAVEREVNEKSQEIVKKHKEAMAAELDDLIRDTVGKMGLRIAKYTQIHLANDRIVIEISDRRPDQNY